MDNPFVSSFVVGKPVEGNSISFSLHHEDYLNSRYTDILFNMRKEDVRALLLDWFRLLPEADRSDILNELNEGDMSA